MKYIVECFNDECLLKAFGKDEFDINHAYSQGKGTVLNILNSQKNRIGMIDYDTFIKHKYFDKCKLSNSICSDIDIYYEEDNKNKLIVIKPKIESLFVRITLETNSMETAKKLGFDNSQSNYHNIRSDKNKLSKLRNLLLTIIQKSTELQNLQINL